MTVNLFWLATMGYNTCAFPDVANWSPEEVLHPGDNPKANRWFL